MAFRNDLKLIARRLDLRPSARENTMQGYKKLYPITYATPKEASRYKVTENQLALFDELKLGSIVPRY